jgi:hypothetical protein
MSKTEQLDFSLQKDAETIRKEVLTNTLKMLRYRKLIKWDNSTIKKFIKIQSDTGEYIVKLDNKIKDPINENEKFNGSVIYIKLIAQCTKSIKNNPIITQFTKKYMNEHKIIIFDDIVDKAKYELKNLYNYIEVFRQASLMIDLMSIDIAPNSCVVLNDNDIIKLQKEYMMTNKQMAKISFNDPTAEYLGAQLGSVIKIEGKSHNSVVEVRYRLVTII